MKKPVVVARSVCQTCGRSLAQREYEGGLRGWSHDDWLHAAAQHRPAPGPIYVAKAR